MNIANQEHTSLARARATRLFAFITQNFAIASAITGLAAYLLGTVFLYSYLSFFDWRLIWLVEQSDILKFGIIAIACFSSFSGLLWMFADDVANIYKENGRVVATVLGSLGLILSLGVAAKIYTEQKLYAEPEYSYAVLTRLAPFLVFLTVIVLTRSFANTKRYSPTEALGDLSIVLVTVAILGATLAVWVRDTEGFEQDVTVDGQVWSRIGVVWTTTHHTVLLAKDVITVIPSSRVTRIQTRAPEKRLRRASTSS